MRSQNSKFPIHAQPAGFGFVVFAFIRKLGYDASLIALLLLSNLLCGHLAFSQQNPNLENGTKPFGSYEGSGIDNVSLTNGNVDVQIPLFSYPQRGSLGPLQYVVEGGAKHWMAVFNKSLNAYQWQLQSIVGAYVNSTSSVALSLKETVLHQVINGTDYYSVDYFVVEPDGATHEVGNIAPNVWESIDATGFRLDGPAAAVLQRNPPGGTLPYVVTDRHGNHFIFTRAPLVQTLNVGLSSGSAVPTSVKDPNGNEISIPNSTSTTDSVGRVITFASGNTSNCPAGTSAANVSTFPTAGGGTSSVTYCYSTINLQTAFNEPLNDGTGRNVLEYSGTTAGINSVVLPNHTMWKLTYDSYGDITSITLPDGGTISYTWTSISVCVSSGGMTRVSRAVKTKTVASGSISGTWNFTWGTWGAGSNWTTVNNVVADPQGNETVHTITDLSSGYCSLYETQTQAYAGSHTSGSLLRTVNKTYSADGNWADQTNSSLGSINVVQTDEVTTVDSGKVTAAHLTYDRTNVGNFLTYGDLLRKDEYDYGQGSKGPLLRSTVNTYQAFASANYLTNNLLNLPSSVQVLDGNGTQQAYTTYGYDESALQSSGVTQQKVAGESSPGNPTSVHRWLNSGTLSCPNGKSGGSNGYIITNATFFDDGMLNTSSDPCGNTTTYAYSLTYQGALPTSVNNALNQSTTFTYDFNTSLLTSTTDPNSQTTTKSYDVMRRPTQVSFPDGGSTKYCYTDMGGTGCSQSGPPYSMVTTKAITSSTNEISTIAFDGLGREVQTQLNSDPQGTDYTVTTYDALGRKSQVYNPTRCNPPTTDCGESTFGYTTYHYDALSRVTSVTEQDGSVTSTDYSAYPCTTVTDEAGKSRKSCANGLGQMAQVFEDPGSSPHLNYETDYGYNALSDLLSVTQKGGTTDSTQWRARSFTYDSVSRLLSASNPESGSIAYAYDPIGNVTTRTAPAPNQTGTATVSTTYMYDALNRLTQKSYNDGNTAAVGYTYDLVNPWGTSYPYNYIGRLSQTIVYNAAGNCCATSSYFHYDPVGRVIMKAQCTPTSCPNSAPSEAFHTAYVYDLAGNRTSVNTGESGITFTYQYDAAQRPTLLTSSLVDSQHPGTLLTVDSSIGYYPTGQIRKITYGNGLTEATSIEPRLQPCRININSSASVISDVCNDGAISGTIQDFEYAYGVWGSTNNGNVTTMDGIGTQNFTRSYVHDPLNRLSTMTDSASNQNCKGLQETYDAWGNRTNQSVTNGSCRTFSAAATTQNRLTGYGYDAAGNLISDGSHTYTYDAENRIISIDGGSTAKYTYDAEGNRVQKVIGSVINQYVYGISGDVLHEVGGTGTFNVHYIYFGGSLAVQMQNSTTYFIHSDHLGSTRLMTNLSGGVYDSMDYLPFGEQIAGDTGTTHKFDGKERDAEDGLDNFGARYSSATLGRFMTPDWAAKPTTVPYANFGDPQSLNLYAFVENTPVNRADADGHASDAGFLQRPFESFGGSVYASAQAAVGLDDATFEVLLRNGDVLLLLAAQVRALAQNQVTAQSLASQVPDEVKTAINASVSASNSPTADDKKGGFHEESGVAGTDESGKLIISPDKPGPYSNPDVQPDAHTQHQAVDQALRQSMATITILWHVHPSGRTATHWFGSPDGSQGPSVADRRSAASGAINLVVGARNKTVYFYDGGTMNLHMSFKQFMGSQ